MRITIPPPDYLFYVNINSTPTIKPILPPIKIACFNLTFSSPQFFPKLFIVFYFDLTNILRNPKPPNLFYINFPIPSKAPQCEEACELTAPGTTPLPLALESPTKTCFAGTPILTAPDT